MQDALNSIQASKLNHAPKKEEIKSVKRLKKKKRVSAYKKT